MILRGLLTFAVYRRLVQIILNREGFVLHRILEESGNTFIYSVFAKTFQGFCNERYSKTLRLTLNSVLRLHQSLFLESAILENLQLLLSIERVAPLLRFAYITDVKIQNEFLFTFIKIE